MSIKINLPEKRKAIVTFYTTQKMKNLLKKTSEEKNTSISYIINAILEDIFQEELKNEM